tara:strand:- start:17 stop:949 length:933 start_codon:yes stop_codon:yes gene_type:complete
MKLKQLLKEGVERQWVIENLIPKGEIVILYAPTNQFKTFLSLKIALEVITGSQELGHSESGKVWYLSPDTTAQDLVLRIKALIKANYEDQESVISENLNIEFRDLDLTQDYYDPPDNEVMWEDSGAIDRSDGYKLIIFDTFSQSIGGSSINDDSAIRKAIKNLKDWIRGGKHTFSILVIAHAGKNTGKGIMGSSLQKNDFPTVLNIRKFKKQYQLYREKIKDASEGTGIPFKTRSISVDGYETLYVDIGEELTDFEVEILDLFDVGFSRLEIFKKLFEKHKTQQPNKESFRVMFGRKWKKLLSKGFVKDE